MTILTIVLLLAILAVLLYMVFGRKYKDVDEATRRDAEQQKLLADANERLHREMQEVRKEIGEMTGKSREEMQQRLDNIQKTLMTHQKDQREGLQKQMENSQRTIREITARLTKLDDTNKQVLGFAEQMRSLEKVLQNPKQRGVLGEYFLEALLDNILPPNQYKMQYTFPNNVIVDAAVFYRDQIIPVDSKFSLEKYNRMVAENDPVQREQLESEFKKDVKKRIDETSKYIRPDYGTTEFAFMFIPAEGIYYNLLIYNVGTVQVNTRDLIEYAFSKRVIIVSPTSFYAYLETVLQGLKALKIEESVKDVKMRVEALGRHLMAYQDHFDRLGKQIGTVVNTYNTSSKEFKKVDKDVTRITEGSTDMNYEPPMLDKPELSDND